MTEGCVIAHQVPQNRPAPNLYQWLRYSLGMFPKPGTQSATKQHDFNLVSPNADSSRITLANQLATDSYIIAQNCVATRIVKSINIIQHTRPYNQPNFADLQHISHRI